MNFFLYINRKFVLLIISIIIVFFIILVFSKQILINNINLINVNQSLTNVDISKPRFTINNNEKKIFITAQEGNFLNENKILLKNNVTFKSNDFSIETENVIFDRNNQSAKSESKSLFKSKKTTIKSNGFDINDKGNKIIFYGKSNIIIK